MMTRDGAAGFSDREAAHNCLARGTLIETPTGAKPVEQLSVGDRVWGFDLERKEPILAKISAARVISASETVRVGRLQVTPDHPLYVDGEWKPAGKLKPADVLLGIDLSRQPASDIEILKGDVEVYDISVAGPENFFAGGVLVHNKNLTADGPPTNGPDAESRSGV